MLPKINRVHTNTELFPDWIEIGKVGSRLHISFNADNLEQAIDRIDSAFVARDYAVQNIMKVIEKEIKTSKNPK